MAVFPRHFLLTLALLLAARAAPGAEALKAELLPLTLFPRSGAPAFFDLRLTHRGAGLLEGRVAITLHHRGEPALRWTTHELALPNGTQTLRLLSPPLPARRDGASLTATLSFETARGALPLGETLFASESLPYERRAVIAVGAAGTRPAPGASPAWLPLRLEQVLQLRGQTAGERAATTPIFFEPAEFPTDALAYCAFDLVLLEEAQLEKLRPRALAALVRWLEGGGCVAILSQAASPPDRRAVLERWLAQGGGGTPIARSSPLDDAGAQLADTGLGRCAVLAPPTEDGKGAQAAAEFLWSQYPLQRAVRTDDLQIPRQSPLSGPVRTVVPPGRTAPPTWRFGPLNSPAIGPRTRTALPNARTVAPRGRVESSNYFAALLPRTVRVLPGWQVFGILALLVAIIGPLDWLLLGRWRAHRFTWLLFPIAVAAATAATIALAQRALGQAAHRGTVTIKDLGADGRVLRQHRFELTMVPRARTIREPIADAIVTPLRDMRPGSPSAETEWPVRDAVYRGQFPARYEFERPLLQWTPALARTLSFGGKDDSGLPWERITPAGITASITDRAGQDLAPGWELSVVWCGVLRNPHALSVFPAPFLWSAHGPSADGTAHPAVAPTGSALCDDFALSDYGDPHQWLILASRRVGLNVEIYRRLVNP